MLFYYGVSFFLIFMSGILNSDALAGLGLLFYFILGMIPALAVCVRRLHDINRSGWWQLITLTIIGIILLIIWWATIGETKKNSHGVPIKLKKLN